MSGLHSIVFVLALSGFGLLCISAGFYGAMQVFAGWARILFLLALTCFVLAGVIYMVWAHWLTYEQFAAIGAFLSFGSFALGYLIGKRT